MFISETIELNLIYIVLNFVLSYFVECLTLCLALNIDQCTFFGKYFFGYKIWLKPGLATIFKRHEKKKERKKASLSYICIRKIIHSVFILHKP